MAYIIEEHTSTEKVENHETPSTALPASETTNPQISNFAERQSTYAPVLPTESTTIVDIRRLHQERLDKNFR